MITNQYRKFDGVNTFNLNDYYMCKYRNETNKHIEGFLVAKVGNAEQIALNHFDAIKGDTHTYLSFGELEQKDADKILESVSSCPYPPYTSGVYIFWKDESF